MVEKLIAVGANVNAVDQYSGETSLHKAINSKQTEIVKILKAAGAKDRPKRIPFLMTARRGYSVINLILRAGWYKLKSGLYKNVKTYTF